MGVSLNKKVKGLIQRLGEAIHETVSESEHVAGVVRDIREQGFDVMLMLEATIGLNELEQQPKLLTAGEPGSQVTAEGPFTPHDLNFLKSLRISLTEETASQDAASQGTASQDAASQDAASQDAASQGPATEKPAAPTDSPGNASAA